MIFARRVAIEQPAQERDERNPLELRPTTRILAIIIRAQQRLEPMRVAQCLRRERRDHLTEPDIALRKRLRLALRAKEDRADDRRSPPNRHDDDRTHVAHIERGARRLQHRIIRRIWNEHRVAGLERALELRIAIEIDDEISDRRIFVTRHESHVGVSAREIDRAAIKPERFAELAGDRLQNVYEMQRGRDVLQDVDYRDELITLALELRDPLLQPGGLRMGIMPDR